MLITDRKCSIFNDENKIPAKTDFTATPEFENN